MLFRTHASAAILTGLLFEPGGLFPAERFAYYSIVFLATALPDIDHENSKIGRAFPMTSRAINMAFGHRGFFHAIALPAGLWLALSIFVSPPIGAAALIGMATHLACDCLTKEGVPLFAPISSRHVRGFVTTGGLVEQFIFALILIAITLRLF
ncbi:MAG: metal-dependent hydrolase [Nanoarchaeota archaeon]